jgi:hypothetical protein
MNKHTNMTTGIMLATITMLLVYVALSQTPSKLINNWSVIGNNRTKIFPLSHNTTNKTTDWVSTCGSASR